MTDVRGYSPGETGTLADVVEQGPSLGAVRPAGPDGFAPPPGGWDLLHAGRIQNRAYRMDFDEVMLRDGYAPIVDALGLGGSENPAAFDTSAAMPLAGGTAMFGKPSRLATAAGRGSNTLGGDMRFASRELQEELVVEQLRARRAKDKNFLPGVPDTIDGLHQYFREAEARKRVAANATIARSSGLGAALTVFAGGGIETFHDPVNIATMPIGGGKTLIQTVGREALANGILEALQLPIAAKNLDELGEHLTLGQAVGDVTTAAVFGGAFGGTLHVAGAHVPPLLFKAMPESVQRRWADRMRVGGGKDAPLLKDVLGDMDNRELGAFARSTIGERMTPDERAAGHVLEREQDLGEASPFEPGPAGDGAHQASLAETLKSIIDGAPRESPKADLLASTAPIASRSPAPVAVPTHAGFAAQWSAIKGNEHGIGAHGEFLTSPKGAVGPAQVMPGTAPYAAKLAGLPFDERRYRTDAAYNEALGRAYYTEQLETFGDPVMAAAAYNAGPGSAAKGTGLRGALRRAAEHGEPGNWEAYLPHETQRYVEDFRRRTGGAAGDGRVAFDFSGEEEAAAFRDAADQAEREAISGARDREGLDVDAAGDRAQFAEVPVLKRDLFDSDEDWADAQAAFHQSLNSDASAPESAGPVTEVSAASEAQGAENAPGEAAGPFGREFPEAAGDWPATLAALRAEKGGVVPGALDHPEIGEIDLPWGVEGSNKQDGFGLAKLEKYHPDVIADLPEIVRSMSIRKRESGRIQLEGPDHRGAVRLDWDGEARTWLLTAFAKDAKHLPKGAPPLPEDRRGGDFGRDGSPDRGAGSNVSESGPIDNAALKAFDDPRGPGATALADSLEHDYRAALTDPERAARTYEVGEPGQERRVTLAELLDEFDRDREAAAALRTCAGLGGAGAP